MNRIAQAPPIMTPDTTQADEALRRVTAQQIGPRKPGVIYYDGPTLVRVESVITDHTEARRILRRNSARFAVLIRDIHAGTERYTGAVWTGSDRVLKAVTV
ncbi:hypothetical protein ACWDCO_24535 [Streptomyces albogriseolus]